MTDPLDTIQSRLRWINRGILGAGILLVIGIFVLVLRTLHSSGTKPPASAASRAAVPAVTAARPLASRPASAAATGGAAAAASAASHPAAVGSSPIAASHPVVAVPALAATATAPRGAVARTPPAASMPRQAEPAPRPAVASAATGALPAEAASQPAARRAAGRRHHVRASAAAASRAAVARTQPAGTHHAEAGRASTHRPAGTCTRAGWYVQVGAFSDLHRYERLRARLRHAGVASCRAAEAPRGLHLLLAGPWPTRQRAEREVARLEPLTGAKGVVRHVH